jgi:predicted GIY-YIG superfamily endonuclease
MMGYVYFISNSSNTGIKIGYSKNPNRRLGQLQTGNPEKLEIIYLLEGTKDTEKYFHRYFSNAYNIKNEWYDYKFVKNWIERDRIEKETLKDLGYIE